MEEHMDELEKYIQDNRAAFDEEQPTDKLWDRIDLALEDTKPASSPFNYWKVAAIVLLLACSALVYMQWSDNQSTVALAPEILKAEAYYQQAINEKMEVIQTYNQSDEAVAVMNDLEELDSLYTILKAKIPESGNRDLVVSAMMQNLQLRVNILNQQIMLLEKLNALEKDENQTI